MFKANLTRHEITCTDVQKIVDQQVAYGTDQTPIRRLIELRLLPEEASQFRKLFFTSYDIECFENPDIIDGLKNCVAVHQVVSIAVSTNFTRNVLFEKIAHMRLL